MVEREGYSGWKQSNQRRHTRRLSRKSYTFTCSGRFSNLWLFELARWQQSKPMGISRHDNMRVRQSESAIAAALSAGLPAFQFFATPVVETRWEQRLIRSSTGFRPTPKEPRNLLPPSARLRSHFALGVPWQVLF